MLFKYLFQKTNQSVKDQEKIFLSRGLLLWSALCQSLEKLWIKRKPNNRWVLQQYHYGRVFEQEECSGEDLPAVLDAIPFADEITIDDLLKMGWYHQGEVVNFPEKTDERG